MGSPVLFTQDRVGLGGRIFKMYKLRTMRPSNTSSTTATSQQDNRITSLGKFLRRHRIDELPQFYNILRGDMSLVGPRPEQPSLAQRYLETIPSFRYRCMLPPGITGWAQINASYASDETETHRKLTYDLYYVKHAGLLLDLWIILITVRAVLLRQGAR
jgi:lipopolysaccharide/colanic/teichoic acid biosynthesis glycosyltransferase